MQHQQRLQLPFLVHIQRPALIEFQVPVIVLFFKVKMQKKYQTMRTEALISCGWRWPRGQTGQRQRSRQQMQQRRRQ